MGLLRCEKNLVAKFSFAGRVFFAIHRLHFVRRSDFWSVRIEGKWFNYGIIFIVMCLDMNMLKNQVCAYSIFQSISVGMKEPFLGV